MLNKKKKQVAQALEVLNGAVWKSNGSEEFPEYVKAICSICVACKLDVNQVMINSAKQGKQETKEVVKKTTTRKMVNK